MYYLLNKQIGLACCCEIYGCGFEEYRKSYLKNDFNFTK